MKAYHQYCNSFLNRVSKINQSDFLNHQSPSPPFSERQLWKQNKKQLRFLKTLSDLENDLSITKFLDNSL